MHHSDATEIRLERGRSLMLQAVKLGSINPDEARDTIGGVGVGVVLALNYLCILELKLWQVLAYSLLSDLIFDFVLLIFLLLYKQAS